MEARTRSALEATHNENSMGIIVRFARAYRAFFFNALWFCFAELAVVARLRLSNAGSGAFDARVCLIKDKRRTLHHRRGPLHSHRQSNLCCYHHIGDADGRPGSATSPLRQNLVDIVAQRC